MPLRKDQQGRLALHCINEHTIKEYMEAVQAGLPAGSTMDVMPNWYYLQAVRPPTPPSMPGVPMVGAPTPLRQLFPVRVYRCRVCGYVETYAGLVIEPDTWGTRNG
jgi:hypothetical protein